METKKTKFGFTIVELLTVMAIIALLLTILAPALRMVRRIAKDTAQRAQFHSIDVALETYSGETEQYPDSTIRPSVGGDPTTSTAPFTVGAHHLAEALLGRDMLGFDPWTTWDAKADDLSHDIYAAKPPSPKNSNDAEVVKSLDRRKGPYLSPDSVEAYQIAQLYTDTAVGTGDVYPGNLSNTGVINNIYSPAPVLTDSYRVKAVSLPNGRQVKAGSPILYYRANISSRVFENGTTMPSGVTDVCSVAGIYNSFDNEELLALGTVADQSKMHNFNKDEGGALAGRTKFYDMITNPTITTQVRPFNQTSYILMSAGFDGIFGTPDDVYNFKN
ncbi:MAG: type II secretion system protein [Phycisphaerae bacterium]|nr:type II secretion system protein [Phycisphaerae bacterium]